MKQQKPLLSIPMIFRDDIRSIERCLKALQPLRDAVPCELIMADTGSVDGSREVAERYADLVIDFPWIDDFAAARNAAVERCTGQWLLTVDTDEYLDEDVSQLVAFLKSGDKSGDTAYVVQRNYDSYEMDWGYNDFLALRMARRSKGAHYVGTIHERWEFRNSRANKAYNLGKTILHHDGYVKMSEAKAKRNMDLLREKIKENPEDLLTHLQLLESGGAQPDFLTLLYNAVDAVERNLSALGAARHGPPIYRYAVRTAISQRLPEKEQWLARAQELYPDSLYVQVDMNYYRALEQWLDKDYAGCILSGEAYLKGIEAYHAGKDLAALTASVIGTATPILEQRLRAILAESCRVEGQIERALSILDGMDCAHMDEEQARNAAACLREMYVKNGVDTTQRLLTLWQGATAEGGPEIYRARRRHGFLQAAVISFQTGYREDTDGDAATSYKLFLPLAEECELGRGAEILDTEDPERLDALIAQVEDWNELPVQALIHALKHGAAFPPPGRVLKLEELDSLAGRIASDRELLERLACQAAELGSEADWQDLSWARSLTLAAVGGFNWAEDGVEPEQGMALAAAFAHAERNFLPLCYTPQALEAERLAMLPSMHRFGWHCARAFDALEAGDAMGYVRSLKAGLDTCKSMKHMVDFLSKYTPELQTEAPNEELAALADQIRTVLARFDPDDPAVAALKRSEAYQKVADLIEGIQAPVVGGLLQ